MEKDLIFVCYKLLSFVFKIQITHQIVTKIIDCSLITISLVMKVFCLCLINKLITFDRIMLSYYPYVLRQSEEQYQAGSFAM